ncbi:MAG TPA: NUDIX hydrolase [Beijerinckiaceae bacterium]|nr:NUDIX hydrolase [Beijerinckiaceae bacterium]
MSADRKPIRQIVDLDRVDASFEAFDWEAPRLHAEAIDAYWEQAVAAAPAIFNGTVLVQHKGLVEGRVFRAAYSPTSYKDFLGYMRLPIPESNVRNGFAMAALRSRDDAFLLGQMSANTANGGKIYFAAGTPDMDDVRNGRVDLDGSVLREMSEETGLRLEEVTIGAGWTCLIAEKRAAFMRDVFLDLPAKEARALMLGRMKTLHEQELSDIVIVRAGDPLLDDPRLPVFVSEYIRRWYARR